MCFASKKQKCRQDLSYFFYVHLVLCYKTVNARIILLIWHLSSLNYLLIVNSLYLLYSGQEKDIEVIKDTLLDGYTNSFWTCSVSKLGYSGTAIISRVRITYPTPRIYKKRQTCLGLLHVPAPTWSCSLQYKFK
jgi:hypothetical protein